MERPEILVSKSKKENKKPKFKQNLIVMLSLLGSMISLLLMLFNQIIFPFSPNILLERSKFNFKTIQVNDVISADAKLLNQESLSVYQQPLFMNQQLSNANFKNFSPLFQNEKLRIEFDFYWNGLIEEYDNPYLDYSKEENLAYIQSSHVEEKYYEYLAMKDNIQKQPVILEDHVFFINYLTLNFTNNQGERTLFEMGELRKPNFFEEDGGSWSSERTAKNSGFGTFSQVPWDTQIDDIDESLFVNPIEKMEEFSIPKENFMIEVYEKGLNVKIFLELDSFFQAELVDISTIQIVAVEKNDTNRVRFMMLNFSSFGRSDTLNLSNIGFPITYGDYHYETQTNDFFFDRFSRFKINEDNELLIGFFEPLATRINRENDVIETFLIFSTDSTTNAFSDINFLYDINLTHFLNDALIVEDTNGLYGGETSQYPFGNEALSQLKLNGIINFNMFMGDISYFTFEIFTPGKNETVIYNSTIFNDVYYLNTGIVFSDDAFLVPMQFLPYATNCNNPIVNQCTVNLKIHSNRIQKVTAIKNLLEEIKVLLSNYQRSDNGTVLGDFEYLPNYFWGTITQPELPPGNGVIYTFEDKTLDFIGERNQYEWIFLQLKFEITNNIVIFEIDKEAQFIRFFLVYFD